MEERLIKPYEISVWKEEIINGVFTEKKLAIIGSDTMTGYNKVYDPVFNKKINGEKSLTFSLKYKYFDPFVGSEDFVNPFAGLLTNEVKVKLHYDDEWYEFIVKECNESSDEYTWKYTCTDAFVSELSKIGYNITFDTELDNNQGTAFELARETIKDTAWKIGEVNAGKQYVEEPIYKANLRTTSGITIINVDGNTDTISSGTDIYLFYSYVKNNDGKNVQFITREKRLIDSKNVITDTNFRIIDTLVYKTINSNTGFYKGNTLIISIGDIETQYHANRLAYNQLTTYDPVTERTVKRYKSSLGKKDVYSYTDFVYTTSNVVLNYVVNGENFDTLGNGTIQGWSPYVFTHVSSQTINDGHAMTDQLYLTSRPPLGTNLPLIDVDKLSQVEGFLRARMYYNDNYIFNAGFEGNSSIIDSISKGERFVFRFCAGYNSAGEVDNLGQTNHLRAVIAKYTEKIPSGSSYSHKYFDKNDIIISFNGTPNILNNEITGGYFSGKNYIIDGVPQEKSTKYVYVDGNGNKKVWNISSDSFETYPTNNYLKYNYIIGSATKTVTASELSSTSNKYGIFIYTLGDSGYYFFKDIQITRYYADANNQPVLIGNLPEATTIEKEYYYVKPEEGKEKGDVELFTDPTQMGLGTITPLYNEDSEKTLTISASQSNCFDILQTIAETFECWIDLRAEYNSDGSGALEIDNETGLPKKYVYLKEYAGRSIEDNWAGFRYGINLNSIERTINSDEIVTKLIVDQSQSNYNDEGFISIASAPSNSTGESYILNFDYFYKQGLLDEDATRAYLTNFTNNLSKINTNLEKATKKLSQLENSLTAVESKRTVYSELISQANEMKNNSLDEFRTVTQKNYSDYRIEHSTLEDFKQYTKNQTVLDILGRLYSSSSTINNYTGLAITAENEYNKLRRQAYGQDDYRVTIWAARDKNKVLHIYMELDDYLSGFKFETNNKEGGYVVTPNERFFDVEILNEQIYNKMINFVLPNNYRIETLDGTVISGSGYLIDYNKVARFKVIHSQNTIYSVKKEIEDLRYKKEQLVKEFNNKYEHYIKEGTWSSTDYIDSELYYLDALQVSNTSAYPSINYSINVIEISQLEGLEAYSFDVGDKTYVEDTEFFGWSNVDGVRTPAREEVIVSEIEWHLENPNENSITVQNYKTRFEDLFQRISATVQTVQYNEATYAKTSTILDSNGTLNQNVLLDSLNKLSGQKIALTSDGSVLIDKDNLLIRNLNNMSNQVLINSEGIRISSDGGLNWTTAINGRGINIDAVYTGTLNTDNIIIGNRNNPSFRWDSGGISAYKSNAMVLARTEDTEIVQGKTYYIYDEEQNKFVPVAIPDPTELDQYYEYRIGYDLQTYVRFDEYGLYGIKEGQTFKAENIEEIEEKAHFGITWDGFFIKNSYPGGGRVEITSDNDFRVLKKDPLDSTQEKEVIKIGALEWNGSPIRPSDSSVEPSLYGIRITNDAGIETFKTGTDGNVSITGKINATSGDFTGLVNVGPSNSDHIIINGESGSIYSSNNQVGAGYGWVINKDGDATFNNITARGAIKTAVFEYAEIQAVGGISIFRPSSVIKDATEEDSEDESNRNLIITVATPYLFKKGDWCKISNYINDVDESPNPEDILNSNGLLHTYKIINIESNGTILTLENAKDIIDGPNAAITNVEELVGGALINMGTVIYKLTEDTEPAENKTYYEKDEQDNYNVVTNITSETDPAQEGYYEKDEEHTNSNNYGIGINSSDNVVNLPRRAISLFETDIDETKEPKVKYKYKTILGTLPTVAELNETNAYVNNNIYNNLATGQGIYTNNMYIGDNERYLAFYKNDTGSGMAIKTDSFNLKSGNPANSNLIYLSDQPYGTAISVAGSPNTISDWTQVIGDNFGVTSNGTVYARGIRLTGSIYIGDSDLSNFVGIENGGIVLGQNNGFHIYIDGESSGNSKYQYKDVYTKTYGLGFYESSHVSKYVIVNEYDFDPENNIYYEKASSSSDGSAIPVYENGVPKKIKEKELDVDNVGDYCVEVDQRIAYINGNKLSIPYTVVLKGMALGDDWIWELQSDTSNLTLKWNR